jgi:hypothetical protein
MVAQPASSPYLSRLAEDLLASTRQGVVERMADPYLTDHDRWVLRRFDLFLGGLTPAPYPRPVQAGPAKLRQRRRAGPS